MLLHTHTHIQYLLYYCSCWYQGRGWESAQVNPYVKYYNIMTDELMVAGNVKTLFFQQSA